MSNDSILVARDERGVATVTLNRPELHNAFDDAAIASLVRALKRLEADPQVRVVVLTGAGKSFCAGGDANWMRAMAQYDEAGNVRDAAKLAELMRVLNDLGKPTVARVNGAAFGGGVGLIACCDIAVGVPGARFALTEVKLGLVPAVISPYVVAALGARQARRFFLTAEAFSAEEARQMGLLHLVVAAEELDSAVAHQAGLLLAGGPCALREAKRLVAAVSAEAAGVTEEVLGQTVRLIARLRVSPEGQEGLTAFLEKRPPSWSGHEKH